MKSSNNLNGAKRRSALEAFMHQFGFGPREREVFCLLVAGKAPKEIASALALSESTVRFHAVRFYRKCGVRNQREVLALFARGLQGGS